MADIEPAGPSVVTIDLDGAAPAPAEPVDPDVVVVAPAAEDEEDALPKTAALQPDGSVILTLAYPVVMRWKPSNSDQVREERRDTLRFYRLTGADMRVLMNAGKGNAVPTGLARSCRMAVGVFNALYDRMDGADSQAAAQVLNYFLSAGVPTPSGPPASR